MRKALKRERMRLARSELLVALAVKTLEWQYDLDGTNAARGKVLPFDQWPPDDPFRDMCARYNLAPTDLAKLLDGLGQQLEDRAERTGYEEAWL